MIEGTVKYEGSGDVTLAVYQDGISVDSVPSKLDKYLFDKAECTNDATLVWNDETWEPTIKNFTKTKTKCSVYFRRLSNGVEKCNNASKTNLGDCLIYIASTDTVNFMRDGTADNNLRYIGADPDNYIRFNGELYRIIGVMNNIYNSSGTRQTRVKIVKDDILGNYIYDTTSAKSNNWPNSTLKTELNTNYYNTLDDVSKTLIEPARWNLGTQSGWDEFSKATAPVFYNNERSNTVYSGNATNWVGTIGMIYPSDAVYAIAGNETTSRTTCLSQALYDIASLDCLDSTWLYDAVHTQWYMTPRAGSSTGVTHNMPKNVDCCVQALVTTAFSYAVNGNDVRPSMYLKSTVKIHNGDGTKDNPYTISL